MGRHFFSSTLMLFVRCPILTEACFKNTIIAYCEGEYEKLCAILFIIYYRKILAASLRVDWSKGPDRWLRVVIIGVFTVPARKSSDELTFECERS